VGEEPDRTAFVWVNIPVSSDFTSSIAVLTGSISGDTKFNATDVFEHFVDFTNSDDLSY
jgi:hypothetical protein